MAYLQDLKNQSTSGSFNYILEQMGKAQQHLTFQTSGIKEKIKTLQTNIVIPNNTTLGPPVAEPTIKQTVFELLTTNIISPPISPPIIPNNTTLGPPVAEPTIKLEPIIPGQVNKIPILPIAAIVGAGILIFAVVRKKRK